MEKIDQSFYSGERPLFKAKDLIIENTVFGEGESPLKESKNIELKNSIFKWKYPLWYASDITANNCFWENMARAGVWYSNNLNITDCAIDAPKNFRRCKNLNLKNVSFSNAAETLWHCDKVNIENCTAKGDYFFMNSKNIKADNLTLYGNYSFDGVENAEIRNSKLLSKDAFWNSKNITVYDSFVSGEYLGWNAENLTLINCTVESLQGMCYINNLVMKNCRLINTTLAFEYSDVDAEIIGKIDSVLNPKSGVIRAEKIDFLTVNEGNAKIICNNEN